MNSTPAQPILEKTISKAALKVALGGGISLVAGLAAQMIIAYLFGAGAEMDAFYTSATIPYFLQISLLSWLPFIMIPAFVNEETAGHIEDAWSLVRLFFILTGSVLTVIALVCAFFSPQIISVVVPGFSETKAANASAMLVIQIFSLPFIGLATFTAAVENARSRFFWPAAATAIGSTGNLLCVILLHSSIGILALPWGALVSTLCQCLVTTIPVLRHGWTKSVGWRDPRFVEMLRLSVPFIVFGLIISSRSLLERYFASSLPDGQLSYIGYANKISNIFVVLLASSIASAIFPTMARNYARKGLSGLTQLTDHGLRLTLATALPTLAITSALATPLVTILYQRGAFDLQATQAVCIIVPVVLFGDLLLRMIGNIIVQAFYILKDTLTANIVFSATIIIYIIAAIILVNQLGYIGLALAQPVQGIVSVTILCVIIFNRLKPYPSAEFVRSILLFGTLSLGAALTAWAVIQLLNKTPVLLQLAAGAASAATLYMVVLNLVNPSMAQSIMDMTGLSRSVDFIRTHFIRLNETRKP